jgi:hypothetical protein
MDADTPKPSIHITLNEATMAQVRRSAERDRRSAGDDALNKIKPGQSERAKAVWQGEGGSIAADMPLPTLYLKR